MARKHGTAGTGFDADEFCAQAMRAMRAKAAYEREMRAAKRKAPKTFTVTGFAPARPEAPAAPKKRTRKAARTMGFQAATTAEAA